MSHRKHLESVRAQMKKAGKSAKELARRFRELEPIELEKGSERLLSIYNYLDMTRARGEAGPLAISYVEIKAYAELMDEPLTPNEVSMIRSMDIAFLDESYKVMRSKSKD